MTGERVDPATDWRAMPREEWDMDSLRRCEHIDLAVSWVGGEEPPTRWRCPDCGGTEFDAVHRDYEPSGLQPG
jgi:hypothetical protein